MTTSTSWFFFLPLVVFSLLPPYDRTALQPPCYAPGETIATEVYVYDAAGHRRRLLEMATPQTKVLYLLVFGGPTYNSARSQGGLWCEDTFNDMPISNYLYLKYRERGVTFVPVACPPIYHAQTFGYDGNVLWSKPEGTLEWHAALANFIKATRALQENHVIPFDDLYFDPKFRLLFNFAKMGELPPLPERAPVWMGKFKPAGDQQCYSTPAIWLLSPNGEVLHAPFSGNRYAQAEQRLRYTARDLEDVLVQALGVFASALTAPGNPPAGKQEHH